MVQEQARQEKFNIINTFVNCKLTRGSQVSPHVLKIKSYLEQLQRLGLEISCELTIDIVLQSLPDNFDQFVMSYNMHGMEKSLTKLHGMLKISKLNIKSNSEVLMVQKGKNPKKRRLDQGKGNGKVVVKTSKVDAPSTT
ncbi:Retrovirus-related Pol polyprotein from transposon TNT 1-94 [Cucumis melo var. makuwa]|uniref:Retrovirus-related Pol polyprotein from transposon TNT 1-94 n=1 Tax=Cucumis melo var. makuwa TaxID=1194695 RepID=A0A5A7V4Y1_CUCMM|nr:Retrovirus-related Pol polyprotein from transposon TNT 1-94 [Cucumis melo var. makuwa]